MSRLIKYALLGIFSLVLTTAPLQTVTAQQIKPVAVVSVASVEKLLTDAVFLTRAAGAPEFGALVTLMTADFIDGLDKTKPGGAYISIAMGQPQVVAFVGVTDLKRVLENRKNDIGEPEDAGDGILKIGSDLPNPIYIKEKEGWAFISNSTDNLGNLPADPSKLLGGLEKQYNVALRVNVQNVPAPMKKIAVTQMKVEFENSIKEDLEGEEDPALREIKEKVGRRMLKSIVSMVEDSDQVTIGWGIDSMSKTMYLDFSMTAIEGTKLARRMNMAGQAKSAFRGFLLPDAAATLGLSNKMPKEDAELLGLVIETGKKAGLKEMKNDKNLTDTQFAAAKEVVGTLFDVTRSTIESGKLDGGAAVVLKPKAFTFVAGGYVSDGVALEGALKKVAELAKNEPDFPGVKFNADNHRNVRFHTMEIPIPEDEDEAKKFFGDSLDVVFGVSGNSIYFAFGEDGLQTLKKVIDNSADNAKQDQTPIQFNVALAPIFKFASSVEEDPTIAVLAAALDTAKGRDHISITNRPIKNGTTTRLKLEDGVMLMIGQALKASLGGGGGGF